MTRDTQTRALTRRELVRRALPLIAANIAVPLAGVIDTVVLGIAGDKTDLAGVALGVLIVNVFYWSFVFLRMSTTGLVAQAHGEGDEAKALRILVRALVLGGAAGVLILLARPLALWAGLAVLDGETEVEALGARYAGMRFFGLPASFVSFALTGYLIALGRTTATLAVQLVYSIVNIALSVLFVLGFGWGAAGVGAATAIGEWAQAGVAGVLVWREVGQQGGAVAGALERTRLWAPQAVMRLVRVNGDLFIRTWALLFGFGWFTNASAGQGAAVLAGTHVLLQFVTVVAFVLDAYAYVAEAEVGKAIGAKSRALLNAAVRLGAEFSFASGAVFMVAILAGGPFVLELLVADRDAREAALIVLPYCAAVPFLGAGAWLLDGVFIGAAAGPSMRNATVFAALGYVGLDLALRQTELGAHGLWIAFLGFYVLRGAALAVAYPRLGRRFGAPV